MKSLLLSLLLFSGVAATTAAAQQSTPPPAKPKLETARQVERQETRRLRRDARAERHDFRQDGRLTTQARETSRRELEPRRRGPRTARP